jgi:hypothetical protein
MADAKEGWQVQNRHGATQLPATLHEMQRQQNQATRHDTPTRTDIQPPSSNSQWAVQLTHACLHLSMQTSHLELIQVKIFVYSQIPDTNRYLIQQQ